MNTEIKTVIAKLYEELRKDLAFFGTSGALVGWLLIAQHNLKMQGIGPKESLAEALFSDLVSFNAFGFIFIGLIALGAIATTLQAFGRQSTRLDRLVAHVESRLAQFASSIISFTLGLSAFSLLHAGVTITGGGAVLAVMVILFNSMIAIGFCSAALIARRKPPLDKWWIALGFLLFSLAALVQIIFHGVK